MIRKYGYIAFLIVGIIFPLKAEAVAEEGYPELAADKLGRGVGNIIYSPAEVPIQIAEELQGDDYVYALPKGIVKGSVFMVGRIVVGAYETATFIIPQEPIIHSIEM